MEKVDRLRKKYPRFVYEKYFYQIFKNDLKIFFDFRIAPDIRFRPTIIVKNIDKQNLSMISDKLLDNLVFHLGLMEIPSYWKTTCSPEIEIRAGYLNKEQIKWWKDLIINGMGQFFYENRIDFRESSFLKIISNEQKSGRRRTSPASFNLGEVRPRFVSQKNRFLIPMGDGKDSIVTLELLKRKKLEVNCFIVNPFKEHFKILKIAGIKNPVIVERKVDPTLLALNRKGFLNGHTPITALISNLAVFCGVLFGYGNVVMSCEKSANEGNIKYLPPHHNGDMPLSAAKLARPAPIWCGSKGKIINHQWSKSFEFEEKFRYYSKKYLTKEVEYFSFLRPLYEIQIARLFSKLTKYFSVFLSCNEAYKTASGTKKPTGKWCGKCSKCLFIWTILYPFVKEKELIKIFKKNLFKDKNLIPIMKELIGDSKCKPLECVGTKKESLIAFYLSYKKSIGDTYGNFYGNSDNLSALLKYFQNKVLPNYSKLKLENDSKRILNSWNKQNNLPKKFDKILRKAYYK
ncbi:hypothetical protein KAU51_00320 [Candidatus Parcubacteria bacterium]|nr:hypothetical protein [Candidatus Parcubacteria bacterium]